MAMFEWKCENCGAVDRGDDFSTLAVRRDEHVRSCRSKDEKKAFIRCVEGEPSHLFTISCQRCEWKYSNIDIQALQYVRDAHQTWHRAEDIAAGVDARGRLPITTYSGPEPPPFGASFAKKLDEMDEQNLVELARRAQGASLLG